MVWGLLLVVYASFTYWYTNTEGPMTEEEIQAVLSRYPADSASLQLEVLENFMRNDTGNQFIMVNLIDMNENPRPIGDKQTAAEHMGYYMEYMYPALFARASHPIFAGVSVGASMDLLGIENAENWDSAALMRYRSRRDVFEIAANPVFNERHEHKLEALTKTIANPVEVQLSLGDPRFILALLLIVIGQFADKFISNRASSP